MNYSHLELSRVSENCINYGILYASIVGFEAFGTFTESLVVICSKLWMNERWVFFLCVGTRIEL